MNSVKLAINGGERVVPEGFRFKVWPEITAIDEEYVLASLRGDAAFGHAWGPNCEKLQDEWAEWNGNKYVLAANSGTAALHMAIAACGIGPGDEVIMTTTSWTSSATCVLHHNALPVFCDIDYKTILMDTKKIEERITEKTKAILAIHYWGLPCDMDPIMEIAKRYNLYVIEDACQAHGSLYKGKKAGTIGHCAAFSLNQNKTLCAGEGGLFVTDNEEMLETARAIMNFGEMKAPGEHRDYHSYSMGWMYRMNDITAAFARAELTKLDENNKKARDNWNKLKKGLEGIRGLVLPFDSEEQTTNGYAFIIRTVPEELGLKVEDSKFRDCVIKALKAEGIPVDSTRLLLPAHTVIQAKNGYGKGCPWSCHLAGRDIDYSLEQYPVSIKVMNSSVQIAINGHRPPNGNTEIDYIIQGVRKVFESIENIPIID